MSKNNYFWVLIVLLIVVIVLIVPRGISYGGLSSMHSNYGMMGGGVMGGGMIGFWWIIPVLALVLIIAAGVWLGNLLTFRSKGHHPSKQHVCPNCSKPTEADWSTCPHCSESLKK